MFLFPAYSSFDADVEKATSDKNTVEDWTTIMEICDKVTGSSSNCKECLRSIVKRLNNPDPHVVLQAITLLDACVNNCAKSFHLEVASREFEQEYKKLLLKSQSKIADRLKQLLCKWAEGEFKSDPQLSLIPSLYAKLKLEGIDFNVEYSTTKVNSDDTLSKDPNSASSQQEVNDLAKAIELSLKETKCSNKSSIYPSTNNMTQNSGTKEKLLVRALYDFEAAEDNELTFFTGEIVTVLDDSDKNWWKGSNHRGEGLFPANFVTLDLSTPDEPKQKKSSKKGSVQLNVEYEGAKSKTVVINEQQIDSLMHMLHEANPKDDSTDTEQMIALEEEVNAMGPLIDTELEKVDRKHAQLTQLSTSLVDALNLYHTLMREPYHTVHQPTSTFTSPTHAHNMPPAHMMPVMYNGLGQPVAPMVNYINQTSGIYSPYEPTSVMPSDQMMQPNYRQNVVNIQQHSNNNNNNMYGMQQPSIYHIPPSTQHNQ